MFPGEPPDLTPDEQAVADQSAQDYAKDSQLNGEALDRAGQTRRNLITAFTMGLAQKLDIFRILGAKSKD